ncbi:Lipase member H [Portunus trituberculatus]|uniref:Lipase member H n=1 Tax=Portunus trituberculatus TaxID=210409 RepID=A0A5B7CZN0_PORTR|nr:Lipase member H [Portunus trituberculatus]
MGSRSALAAAHFQSKQTYIIIHGFLGSSTDGWILSLKDGLDPAGLRFHQADSADRLHHSDAVFVDVIHTHGCYTFLKMWEDCFGIDENLGDADFWPNGGERQPACEDGGDGATSVKGALQMSFLSVEFLVLDAKPSMYSQCITRKLFFTTAVFSLFTGFLMEGFSFREIDGSSCDHGMAYVLYIESIKYMPSSTHFLARQCPSWKHYNNKSCPCGHPVQYMGFNADPRAHGVFYLNTSRTAPYGLLDSDCSAGAFSLVQIIGLMILSILLVLLLLLVGLVLIQQYFGLPILVRVRARLYMEDLVWHGLGKSPSTHILNSDKAVDT